MPTRAKTKSRATSRKASKPSKPSSMVKAGSTMMRATETAATEQQIQKMLGFTGISQSADEELRHRFPGLRHQARLLDGPNQQFANPYFVKWLNECEKNIIGCGVKVNSKVLLPNSEELDRATNDMIEWAWHEWCTTKEYCTANQQQTFYDVENQVVRTAMREGEVLVRKIWTNDNPFGFTLRLLEGDYLDHDLNQSLNNGHRISMGIQMDENDRRIAYHLFTTHPGEIYQHHTVHREVVPADEIIHIFLPRRIGQNRGFPTAVSVLQSLYRVEKYERTEVQGCEAASRAVLQLTRSLGDESPEYNDNTAIRIDDSKPVSLVDGLQPGEELKGIDWNKPNAAYPEARKGFLRNAAVGMNIGYNNLGSDLEGVNFSSLRSGDLNERETWMALQRWIITRLHTEVFKEWLWVSTFNRKVTLPVMPDKMEFHRLYNRPEWKPRRWPWVDPEKDLKARVMEIENGLKSRREVIAEMGGDIETVYEEQALDNKLAAEKKLSFPTGASAPKAEAPQAEEPVIADDEPKSTPDKPVDLSESRNGHASK